MYDLIVVGSGPGGMEAAMRAGERGKKVLLCEAGDLGGVCLNCGCIPTKTLLKSAHVYAAARDAAEFGVHAGAVEFSFAEAAARKDAVVKQLRSGVEASLRRAKVEIVSARARLLGDGKVMAGGQEYAAENILLACGGRPAVPPIPGIGGPAVLDSTGILRLDVRPETLCVIGGGVIGLEFASFFNTIGTQVTVIEMLPQIGGALDGEMAKRLQQALQKAGIAFFLKSGVKKVDGNTVTFAGPDGAEQTVTAEKILCATGRAPNTADLGLEAAGVEFDRRGVRTDACGATTAPGVWACGDITGRSLLAHSAAREGAVAVENMFGGGAEMRYDAIPGVVYTAPEVAGVGATEEQLKAAGTAYVKAAVPLAAAGRFTVEYPAGAPGTLKVLADAADKRILGVHMIGGPAGEIIHSACVMLAERMTAPRAAAAVFPHPTVSEALKLALEKLA